MVWQLDKAHSSIEFTAKHMMLSTIRGRFHRFDGQIEMNEQHPERSIVDIQIYVDSLDTYVTARDQHLKSPDFLDVQNYPLMTFKSKHIRLVRGTQKFYVFGELTIKDIAREVVLEVTNEGQARLSNNVTQGFSATATINRRDWGMEWNVLLDSGGWLVGDQVKILIELELTQEARVAA